MYSAGTQAGRPASAPGNCDAENPRQGGPSWKTSRIDLETATKIPDGRRFPLFLKLPLLTPIPTADRYTTKFVVDSYSRPVRLCFDRSRIAFWIELCRSLLRKFRFR